MRTTKFYSAKEFDIHAYAERLYKVRETINFTVREMSEALGVSAATYVLNENAHIKKIPANIVDGMVNIFHVDIDTLLIPITSNKLPSNVERWLKRKEAVPYIMNAYHIYLADLEAIKKKKIEEAQTRLQDKIKATNEIYKDCF